MVESSKTFINIEVLFQNRAKNVRNIVYLRWLKAVSSTFQDVDFDGSLLPLVLN